MPKKGHAPELLLSLVLALAGLVAAVILALTGHGDLARIVLGLDFLHGATGLRAAAPRRRIEIRFRR